MKRRVTRFARHTSSDLNRHGGKMLDDAVEGGVVLDALADVAMILAGGPLTEPRIAWLAGLDRDDLRAFATEVAAAARLSMETDNAGPLHDALYAWRSTAEYELAGAPFSNAMDQVSRPAAEAT